MHDIDKLLDLIPIVNFALALHMLFADGMVDPKRYGQDPQNHMPYNVSINVNVNVNTESRLLLQQPFHQQN